MRLPISVLLLAGIYSLSIAVQAQAYHGQAGQVVVSTYATMPLNAAKARNRVHVKPMQLDQRGVAHLSGSIVGLGMDVYHFRGQAGDTIRIINERAPAMVFGIFRPDLGMRFGNYQRLPVSGDYELRIVNDRKNAAYSKKPRPYRVTFTLSRGGQVAAPRAATVVNPVAIRTVTTTVPTNLYRYRCKKGTLSANFTNNGQVTVHQNGRTIVLSAISIDHKGNALYSDGRYTLTSSADTHHVYALSMQTGKKGKSTRVLAKTCHRV